ncbi:MAG: hypothetical protein JNK82_23990 [Myxococcaceae bacterium]|nr:hypothetical protein [Myxococcaceae bacterium]
MLVALVVFSVLAQSQPDEWAAPPSSGFTYDAGSFEDEAPDAGGFTAAPVDAGVRDAGEPPAPDPRRFTWGHVALGVNGMFGQSGYYAVRIEAGAVYGWPRRMRDSANRAMGLTLGVAIDLLAAKLQVSLCGSTGVCGSRYQAGLAVRAAWNWGVIGNDGVVAPIHAVFVQGVPFTSSNEVPSAPLFPASSWVEHGVRFDVGLTSGFLRGSTWPKPGAFVIGGGLYFALSLEWLLVNNPPYTGQFRGGLTLGLGI